MSQPPKAVGAGRGLLFISGAKLWFMVAGYVIQFGLPRALSLAEFGVWVLVLSVVSPINNVIVTATVQSVSRFVAEVDSRAAAVTRAALRMQLLVAGGVALTYALLAPLIARSLVDENLTPLLRLSAGVVFCYGFYSVFVGHANGARAFHKQAGLDASFSTMRALFVVGAAIVTHSVFAAIGGFVAAAAAVLVLSILWVGWPPKTTERFPMRTLAPYFASISVYLLLLNLLMFVDGLVLKSLVTQHALDAGRVGAEAYANTQAGIYGAAQALARIPYQLILVATFVVFPLVSRSTFEQDHEKTRLYVQTTLRYSLVAAALLGSALGARPSGLLHAAYAKVEYAAGAGALWRLVLGYVCFSLFAIGGSILNGAGRVVANWVLCSVTLAVAALGNLLAVRAALAAGTDPLSAAATATAVAMAVGAVGTLGLLWRAFSAAIPVSAWLRVGVCTLAAAAVGHFWPSTGALAGKLGALLCAALAASAFLAVAIATGELRPRELLSLRRATKN